MNLRNGNVRSIFPHKVKQVERRFERRNPLKKSNNFWAQEFSHLSQIWYVPEAYAYEASFHSKSSSNFPHLESLTSECISMKHGFGVHFRKKKKHISVQVFRKFPRLIRDTCHMCLPCRKLLIGFFIAIYSTRLIYYIAHLHRDSHSMKM